MGFKLKDVAEYELQNSAIYIFIYFKLKHVADYEL